MVILTFKGLKANLSRTKQVFLRFEMQLEIDDNESDWMIKIVHRLIHYNFTDHRLMIKAIIFICARFTKGMTV
jgi:hypothetical protein